ncbi:alpha/beta-hydrolase [Thozetella sp. PMI_491]|nr:alpha/beta-hydrolase [Thozetella sp. PMI_491]
MDRHRPLTTADIPPRFLRHVFLVGRVPRAASQYDPRISYGMYVPQDHYNPNPAALAEAGTEAHPKLPLLVQVHGTGRDVDTALASLMPFANATPCAVVCPLFPTGLDGPSDLDSYKLLRSKTLKSDLALLAIFGEIAFRWPGIDTTKVFLMGFSGGAQFSQRFLYLHPERLAAVSVGAPGRVTALDRNSNWPAGIRDVEAIFGKAVEPELIRNVRIQMVVGTEDNYVPGGQEFWSWIKEMRQKEKEAAGDAGPDKSSPFSTGLPDIRQGRLDTLRQLHEAWKNIGIDASLDFVEGVAHDATGVRERVLDFMRPLMEKKD